MRIPLSLAISPCRTCRCPGCPSIARRWRELAGEDFWPYGIEPNRPTLEAFAQYAFEQGVTAWRLPVEELFAPETRRSFKI